MQKKIFIIAFLAGLLWLAGFSEIRADDNQPAIDVATDYLSSQSPDPWITMALIAAGKPGVDLNYLKTINRTSATDYENAILALTAANENPRTFDGVDYVAELKTFYQSQQIGSVNYVNDDFWGIMALVSAGEDINSQIIQDSKDFILTNQNADGGWSYAPGNSSDIDDTAAAIMALLDAGVGPSNPVITSAVDYLKSKQNADGGFPYDVNWGTTSNAGSDSWVISAIYKLGQSPADWSQDGGSPVDNLKSLQRLDGSFDEGYPDSTAYAVIALSQKFYPVNKITFVPETAPALPRDNGGSIASYTINATAGEHGSILPSGILQVNQSNGQSFIITPDQGYHVADVLVDGVSVGQLTGYDFSNIGADHTISVSFATDAAQPVAESVIESTEQPIEEVAGVSEPTEPVLPVIPVIILPTPVQHAPVARSIVQQKQEITLNPTEPETNTPATLVVSDTAIAPAGLLPATKEIVPFRISEIQALLIAIALAIILSAVIYLIQRKKVKL